MRVVISRTDAIGDTTLTIPLAQAIKERFPESRVAFLVAPRSADLFNNHPYIDEVWVYNHSHSFISKAFFVWRKMRAFKADHFFHVGGSFIPSFVAWFRCTPFRGGLLSRWKSFLFINKGVRQKRSLVEMHEVEYNLNLLAPLGIHYQYTERKHFEPIIHLDEQESQKAFEEFCEGLKELRIPIGEMIFVHPGMMGHTLNWPVVNYVRLLLRIEEMSPQRFTYVVSYTNSDTHYLNVLRHELELPEYHQLRERIYYFDGSRKGLRNFMNVLSFATLFIGPSTGPTHLANTLGVKTLGLYSPIKTQSSFRWGPYRGDKDTTLVMVPDVVCGESIHCLGEACPYFECMEKLEVEDVLVGVGKLLKIS